MNNNESTRIGRKGTERHSYEFLGVEFTDDVPISSDQIKYELMPHLIRQLVTAGEAKKEAEARINKSLGSLLEPKNAVSVDQLQEGVKRILTNINEVIRSNFAHERSSVLPRAPEKATLILRDAKKLQPVKGPVLKSGDSLNAPVQDIVPGTVLSDTNVEKKEKFVVDENQLKMLREVREMYTTVRKQRDEFLSMGPEDNKMRFFVFNSQFDGYQGVLRGYRALQHRINVYHKRAKQQNKSTLELTEKEANDLQARYERLKIFFDRTQKAVQMGEVSLHKVENPIAETRVGDTDTAIAVPTSESIPPTASKGHKHVVPNVDENEGVTNNRPLDRVGEAFVSNEGEEAELIELGKERVFFEKIPSSIGVGTVEDIDVPPRHNTEHREFSPGDSVFYTPKGGSPVEATILEHGVSDLFVVGWKKNGFQKTSLVKRSELSFTMTTVPSEAVPRKKSTIIDPTAAARSSEKVDTVKQLTEKLELVKSDFSIHNDGRLWYQRHISNSLRFTEIFTYLQENPGWVDMKFKDKIYAVVKTQVNFQIAASELDALLKNDGLDRVAAEGAMASIETIVKQIVQMQSRFNKSTPDERLETLRIFTELQSEINENKKKNNSERFKRAKSFMAKQWEKVVKEKEAMSRRFKNRRLFEKISSAFKNQKKSMKYGAYALAFLGSLFVVDSLRDKGVNPPPEIPIEKVEPEADKQPPSKYEIPANNQNIVYYPDLMSAKSESRNGISAEAAGAVTFDTTEHKPFPTWADQRNDGKLRTIFQGDNAPAEPIATEEHETEPEESSAEVMPSPFTFDEAQTIKSLFNSENFKYPHQLADGSFREATRDEIAERDYLPPYAEDTEDTQNAGVIEPTQRVEDMEDTQHPQIFYEMMSGQYMFPSGIETDEFIESIAKKFYAMHRGNIHAVGNNLSEDQYLRKASDLLDAMRTYRAENREAVLDMGISSGNIDAIAPGEVVDMKPFFTLLKY